MSCRHAVRFSVWLRLCRSGIERPARIWHGLTICCHTSARNALLQEHFDLSIWAFERLAKKEVGVIGLLYRPVPCNYTPAKPAPKPANPTPGVPPPAGAVHP